MRQIIELARALGLILSALVLASSAIAGPVPTATSDILGLWINHKESKSQTVAVWIDECDGGLCGHIYWLKKPLSANGQPKRDRHNPDAALRDRPRCGLKILSGFRQLNGKTWSDGQIYNPSDGQTYSGNLSLESDGSLSIRGFVGMPIFGKTVEWVRPRELPERCR